MGASATTSTAFLRQSPDSPPQGHPSLPRLRLTRKEFSGGGVFLDFLDGSNVITSVLIKGNRRVQGRRGHDGCRGVTDAGS